MQTARSDENGGSISGRKVVTGARLRLALLAIGVPVIAAGALHASSGGKERRWGLNEARAEPVLRSTLRSIAAPASSTAATAIELRSDLLQAEPFILATHDPQERERAVQCLANAVYYEAALEPLQGQRAVAQVVVNRVRDPAFPRSICGVVYQGWKRTTGCQFSFTCDGSLARTPIPALMANARAVAKQALAGYVMAQVGTATHYHTAAIDPWWRPTVLKVAQVGAHVFYRWPGSAGLPLAFNQTYGGGETKIAQDVIDGRAVRPPILGQFAGALTAEAALGAPSMTAGPSGRVHVVAMMPGGRRAPTPDEVAQINAGLAKFEAGKAATALPAAPSSPPNAG